MNLPLRLLAFSLLLSSASISHALELPFQLQKSPDVDRAVKPVPEADKKPMTGSHNPKRREHIIGFQDLSITRTNEGRYLWRAAVKSINGRQIPAGTAMLRVYLKAGDKRIQLFSGSYNQTMNPNYGIFQKNFIPSSESDSLEFDLFQHETSASGHSTTIIAERKTVAMPPFGVSFISQGYEYNGNAAENPYLHARIKNSSPWPVKVRLIFQGGKQSAWNVTRGTETVVLAKDETRQIRAYWKYTDKGYGMHRTIMQMLLLDPATEKVHWTDVATTSLRPLPTN